jgi:long-subunit fatty acid transport protein
MALVVLGLALVSSAGASTIIAPHTGGRDSQLGGQDVATPTDGPGILLNNPAGVVGQSGTRINASLFTIFLNAKYTNPDIGFVSRSSEIPVAPTLWLSSDIWAPWYVGFGLYGSVGASFNFPGNPDVGVPNRLFSELTVLQGGLVAGRELVPGLRGAIQLTPTYGKIRAHFPSPFGPVSIDLSGLGITGVIGLIYDWSEKTSLGLSYRGPGIIYLRGDGHVGEVRDDPELNLHLPQLVTFGLAHHLTESFMLTLQARWADNAQFEKGQFHYPKHPPLSTGPISAARMTFRYGAGAEYALSDSVWLRCGISHEEWMMEPSTLSPLLYDASDTLASAGVSVRVGRFEFDSVIGRPFVEDRVVTKDENPVFPGRYELEGGVAGISVTYRLD